MLDCIISWVHFLFRKVHSDKGWIGVRLMLNTHRKKDINKIIVVVFEKTHLIWQVSKSYISCGIRIGKSRLQIWRTHFCLSHTRIFLFKWIKFGIFFRAWYNTLSTSKEWLLWRNFLCIWFRNQQILSARRKQCVQMFWIRRRHFLSQKAPKSSPKIFTKKAP